MSKNEHVVMPTREIQSTIIGKRMKRVTKAKEKIDVPEDQHTSLITSELFLKYRKVKNDLGGALIY